MISWLYSRLRRRATADTGPGRKRRAPLAFPLNFTGKIAMYEGQSEELSELCAFAPEAIAAPLQRALDLADARLRGLVDLPSLSFAILVLTDVANAPLEQRQRDLLWRAFRVPVFEQLRDWDGTVIARECETHNGLHLVPGADAVIERGELVVSKRKTGLSGSIAEEHCECGAETAILRNLALLPAAKAAAA